MIFPLQPFHFLSLHLSIWGRDNIYILSRLSPVSRLLFYPLLPILEQNTIKWLPAEASWSSAFMRDDAYLRQRGNAFQSICSRQESLRRYLDPLESFRSWPHHVDSKMSRHQEEQEGNGRSEIRLSLCSDGKWEWVRKRWFPKTALAFGKIDVIRERAFSFVFLIYTFCKYLHHSPYSFSHPFIQQMCMEINVHGRKRPPQFCWPILRGGPL